MIHEKWEIILARNITCHAAYLVHVCIPVSIPKEKDESIHFEEL